MNQAQSSARFREINCVYTVPLHCELTSYYAMVKSSNLVILTFFYLKQSCMLRSSVCTYIIQLGMFWRFDAVNSSRHRQTTLFRKWPSSIRETLLLIATRFMNNLLLWLFLCLNLGSLGNVKETPWYVFGQEWCFPILFRSIYIRSWLPSPGRVDLKNSNQTFKSFLSVGQKSNTPASTHTHGNENSNVQHMVAF